MPDFFLAFAPVSGYNFPQHMILRGIPMITTVLFDLDGTLLPMDQDAFVKAYMAGLTKKAAGHG